MTKAAQCAAQLPDLFGQRNVIESLQIDARAAAEQERGPDRPLGLARAATMLGISPTTLERVYEPYLIRLGLIDVTPGGRGAHCAASARSVNASGRAVEGPGIR